MTNDLTIADKATTLILEFEGFSGRVDWPGGMSGPTWGIGYDGAYHTADEIRRDWSAVLPGSVVGRLVGAVGRRGPAAQRFVESMKGMAIPRAAADEVFRKVDIPRWIQRTSDAFPGYDSIPDSVQGALVSLVFNRGGKMTDNNRSIQERREMREVRDAVADLSLPLPEKCQRIAAALRSMSRLWTGKLPAPYNVKFSGLIRRREAEAKLVESGV
jgi:hypothetical protein